MALDDAFFAFLGRGGVVVKEDKVREGCVPTTPPTVLDTPDTVFPKIPVTVLAAPVTPLLLLFMTMAMRWYAR